jgi:hypothetical protein
VNMLHKWIQWFGVYVLYKRKVKSNNVNDVMYILVICFNVTLVRWCYITVKVKIVKMIECNVLWISNATAYEVRWYNGLTELYE